MGRPTKDKSRSRQDVIAAAIVCLDRDGISALGVNAVARELGIKPPAIYKHVDGNSGLYRSVALQIWEDYLVDCQAKISDLKDKRSLFLTGGRSIREFAKQYPHRYRVMMDYRLQPQDLEEGEIINRSLGLFVRVFDLGTLDRHTLIDTMRMVNAAIYGFICRETSDLMTLDRSADDSYEVMLDALIIAIEYIATP